MRVWWKPKLEEVFIARAPRYGDWRMYRTLTEAQRWGRPNEIYKVQLDWERVV